jgi:hypothetical protein
VSTSLASVETNVKIKFDQSKSLNKMIYEALRMETPANAVFQDFLNRCRWFVDAQRHVHSLAAKGTELNMVSIFGYGIFLEKLARLSAAPIKQKRAHIKPANESEIASFIERAEQMRLSGISAKSFGQSLLAALLEKIPNTRYVHMATGVDLSILKNIREQDDGTTKRRNAPPIQKVSVDSLGDNGIDEEIVDLKEKSY